MIIYDHLYWVFCLFERPTGICWKKWAGYNRLQIIEYAVYRKI